MAEDTWIYAWLMYECWKEKAKTFNLAVSYDLDKADCQQLRVESDHVYMYMHINQCWHWEAASPNSSRFKLLNIKPGQYFLLCVQGHQRLGVEVLYATIGKVVSSLGKMRIYSGEMLS